MHSNVIWFSFNYIRSNQSLSLFSNVLPVSLDSIHTQPQSAQGTWYTQHGGREWGWQPTGWYITNGTVSLVQSKLHDPVVWEARPHYCNTSTLHGHSTFMAADSPFLDPPNLTRSRDQFLSFVSYRTNTQ